MTDTSDAAPPPYTFEIIPTGGTVTQFHWIVRKRGQMLQRSDRSFPSAAEAERRALEVLERLMERPD